VEIGEGKRAERERGEEKENDAWDPQMVVCMEFET
jgi:hypothetical protein